jgi:transcriptional regulator with XRE-family HTH domain
MLAARQARARVRSVGSRGSLPVSEGDRRVAANLRRLRHMASLTLDAVGNALGITGQAASKIERGRTRAGVPTLLALADLFGVGIDAFFEPVGSQTASSQVPSWRVEELLRTFALIDDPEIQWVVLATSRTLARESLDARYRRGAGECP